MASLFSLTVLSLFISIYIFPSAAAPREVPRITAQIRKACGATRFPDVCAKTLTSGPVKLPANPNPPQMINSAIAASAENLEKALQMMEHTLAGAAGNVNRTSVAKICVDVLKNSVYRTESSARSVARGGRGDVKDARLWMGAALNFQTACRSGLSYVNDTRQVIDAMALLNDTISLSSNALSMIASFDAHGVNLDDWAPPRTERDGFWEKFGSASGFKPGGVPADLRAKLTVGKDGAHKTVQAAVDAAPSNSKEKFAIKITAGVYKETVKVPLDKRNLVFLGDGIGKTVITGSLAVGPGISTMNTATLSVLGDGFMMSDITVENTAGPITRQAVAFLSQSDRSVIERCEFLGNQDTLYADTLRQYYKSCNIQGNVDFIFGNAAAVFQDCTILVRPRQTTPEKGGTNVVTAHGRTDPAQPTGFVFHSCTVGGTKEYMDLYAKNPKVHKNYLGRPWKEYSRTVFINSSLDASVVPEGWLPWKEDFALKTLFYGEAANTGPGSNLSGRVPWSSKIAPERVDAYTVQNFIQGDQWIKAASA